MKYQIHDVTLWPGCCHLEVQIKPSEEFEDKTFDSVDQFVAECLPDKGSVITTDKPKYEHGMNPFTALYDLTGYGQVYKNPVFLGWMQENGISRYVMVSEV